MKSQNYEEWVSGSIFLAVLSQSPVERRHISREDPWLAQDLGAQPSGSEGPALHSLTRSIWKLLLRLDKTCLNQGAMYVTLTKLTERDIYTRVLVYSFLR